MDTSTKILKQKIGENKKICGCGALLMNPCCWGIILLCKVGQEALWTSFSKTLDKADRIEIGQKCSTSCLGPLLCTAVIIADFHFCIKTPMVRHVLNKIYKGLQIWNTVFLKKIAGTATGPDLFDGSKLFNSLYMTFSLSFR